MSTKFFTNQDQNTLLNKFKGIFENNKDIEFFDSVVGYFRASGYFKIRPFLEDVPNIRILVGIDVDLILAKYQSKGLLFKGDANQTLIEFLSETKEDIQTANYSKDVEDGILQFIEDVVTKKIEIKAHPSKKLHAKIYIFKPENWNEHKPGNVITGSSNLTHSGLGGDKGDHNYEFNVMLRDYDDVKFASEEFEQLWKEGITVLQKQIFDPESDDDVLSLEIRNKKIDLLILQLEIMIDKDGVTDKPQGNSRQIKVMTEKWLQTKGWNQQIERLNKMKKGAKTPLEFFDWKLDFPEIMNPEITNKTGFDIVIGNPPYGYLFKNNKIEFNHIKKQYKCAEYKIDAYSVFIEKSVGVGNENLLLH